MFAHQSSIAASVLPKRSEELQSKAVKMRSMFVAVVGLLATGISARSAEVVESVGPTPPKAIAVRPDWSKLPQGVRITPRLETTELVMSLVEA